MVLVVPGCGIRRSHTLVASGLDMQHLGKARSWTSSGEQFSSDLLLAETKTKLLLHLLDMPSQLKTGVLQCPSWIFWKEGPPLRTRHTISGTDADAARSYEHHMCRDVTSVLPGL